MADIYLDSADAIAGRVGVFAAKRALLGDTVKILNCEKAVISGNKDATAEKYYVKRNEVGQPQKGPFVSRMPDRFLRRIIRGMLPHRRQKGANAYKRIMCYAGVPVQFKDKKLLRVPGADASKLKILKSTTVGEVCKKI